MSKVIVTDPAYDEATKHISHWVQRIVKFIARAGKYTAVILNGKDVTSKKFSTELAKEDTKLLLLNGHGTDSSILGHNNEELVSSGSAKAQMFKGKMIHSWTCSAGKILGPELIRLGALAFIGYDDEFKFVHTNPDPSLDAVSSLFLEPPHAAMEALSGGKTANNAYQKAQEISGDNILLALGTPNPLAQTIAAHLWHNHQHHVMIGEPTASM